MASELGIVDISSDEEDFGVGTDDVVVMQELSAPAVKPKKGLSPGDEAWKVAGDDDCWILDSDPDNPVSAVGHKDHDEGEADELVIVGEKGQLACRDYPHARHLCATFPFNSTPHENHCSLCHCYVCDTPVPCKNWGNGKMTTDHCHSTDKDGNWKLLRESFKQKNPVSSRPPTVPDQLLAEMTGSQNPPPRPYHPNPVQEPSQTCRSSSLLPCSATITGNVNAINTRHHQRSILCYNRKQRVGPYPIIPDRLISRTKSIGREHPGASTLSAQITSGSRWRNSGTLHPVISRREPLKRKYHVMVPSAAEVNKSSRLEKVGTTHSVSDALSAHTNNGSILGNVGITNHLPNEVVQQRFYSETATTQNSSRLLPQFRAQSSPLPSLDRSMDWTRMELPRPPVKPTMVDNSKNIQDILASVASRLGVSSSDSVNTTNVQYPIAFSAEPLHLNQEVYQTKTNADMVSVDHGNPIVVGANQSSGYGFTWLNSPITRGGLEHGKSAEPWVPSVWQPDPVTDSDAGRTRLDSFLAAMEQELLDLESI